MAEPRWKQILASVSEAERNFAKEIVRDRLQREGRSVSEEEIDRMAAKALEEAHAILKKKGKQAFRGLKGGLKAFCEEVKKKGPE